MAKVKMDDLKQTHGALSAPLTIDELTGQTVQYVAGSLEEYRESLAAMSDDEMREHAVEIGEVPVSIRSILVERLERRFVNSGRRAAAPVVPQVKMSKKNQEFQRKFLEGNI